MQASSLAFVTFYANCLFMCLIPPLGHLVSLQLDFSVWLNTQDGLLPDLGFSDSEPTTAVLHLPHTCAYTHTGSEPSSAVPILSPAPRTSYKCHIKAYAGRMSQYPVGERAKSRGIPTFRRGWPEKLGRESGLCLFPFCSPLLALLLVLSRPFPATGPPWWWVKRPCMANGDPGLQDGQPQILRVPTT
jgi:hypothetical protein